MELQIKALIFQSIPAVGAAKLRPKVELLWGKDKYIKATIK